MTPQLKALAEKMAEERYPVDGDYFNRGGMIQSYLAGFEARDGMDDRLREEHAEMLDALKTIISEDWLGEYNIGIYVQSLITKIESK